MLLLLLRHWLPISLVVIVLTAATVAMLQIRHQRNTIAELSAVVASRDASIAQQNHAIDQLKADSVRRAQNAQLAVTTARKQAQPNRSRAATIIVQSPKHDDLCASAIELLDEHLP